MYDLLCVSDARVFMCYYELVMYYVFMCLFVMYDLLRMNYYMITYFFLYMTDDLRCIMYDVSCVIYKLLFRIDDV